jgi:hypothetical protein
MILTKEEDLKLVQASLRHYLQKTTSGKAEIDATRKMLNAVNLEILRIKGQIH